MNAELLKRGLGAQLRSSLIWGISMVALTASVVALWPSLSRSGSLDSMVAGLPPDLVSALGLTDFGSPAGFLNGNLYAVFLPLLFTVLGTVQMNALTAGDEDAGRLELLLALPVARPVVYLSRYAGVALVLGVLAAATGATVGITAPVFDLDIDAAGIAAVSLSMFWLGLFQASLVLALAGLGLRAPTVSTVAFSELAAAYAVYALLPLAGSAADLARWSPWHWALGSQPLTQGFDVRGSALLAASCALLTAVGLLTIRRRTIRTA